MTILVTGASGFIGSALVKDLSSDHKVVGISRKPADLGVPIIKGNFQEFEDLHQLDEYSFDAVVHLAAELGGAGESAAISVNAVGTRNLMSYLKSRGCKKFVNASSIAAIGFQSMLFRPQQFPVLDEHPCLDRNGYGMSKFLMEEITQYIFRQDPALDIINLRLSSITPDDNPKDLVGPGPLIEWAFGHITVMTLSDAVGVFRAAVTSVYKPGVRILNASAQRAWVNAPVADILRSWYGKEVDVSYFEQSGHEYDSLFNVGKLEKEIGFKAQNGPEKIHAKQYLA